ncbi:phosphoglycerate mutase [Longispora fulva]|uniref:histidine phosphatase family protein n=1 Tax=Longispora fulva TaxID=619741 RepID=UPI001A366FBE|nr:histidine phosphatase family protein [Longispora fulva]GIG62643.1 phosphoglycerate mutase [Longispora fulva]
MVLVRHGDSVHKAQRVVGGPRTCGGLTPLGHEQAARLASRIKGQAADWGRIAVYSSTLRRARETAAPISEQLGVPAATDCGLCTWHTPPYADGMPIAELRRDHSVDGGGVFRPFERDNETWAELVTRVSRTLVDIAARHRGGTVLIVGHAETVAASFGGLGLLGHYYPFEVANVRNAAVTEWVTDDDPAQFPPARWTLVRFNDAS